MSEQLRRKRSLRLYPTPKQEALLVAHAQGEIDSKDDHCFTAPGTGVVTDSRGARDSTMLLGTGNPILVP